jgi:surface antigen
MSRPRPAETAPPPLLRQVRGGDNSRRGDRDISPLRYGDDGRDARDRRNRETPLTREVRRTIGGDRDGDGRYERERRGGSDRNSRYYGGGHDRDVGRYVHDRPEQRRYHNRHDREYRDHYRRQRHDFWRDRRRHVTHIHYYAHLNHGWRSPRYYGYWGPPARWRYHSHYYTRGYDRRRFAYYDGLCRYDSGEATLVGALFGAIIGGAIANDDDALAGALIGAGLGAVFADSFDRFDRCDHGQFQYALNYAFEYGEPYYWSNPHTGVRGAVIIRENYYRSGYDCRWADAEIYLPNGGYQYDQVRMCRDAYGEWRVAPRQ